MHLPCEALYARVLKEMAAKHEVKKQLFTRNNGMKRCGHHLTTIVV